MSAPQNTLRNGIIGLGVLILVVLTLFTKELFALLPLHKFNLNWPLYNPVDYLLLATYIYLFARLCYIAVRLGMLIVENKNNSVTEINTQFLHAPIYFITTFILIAATPNFVQHHRLAGSINYTDMATFLNSPFGYAVTALIIGTTVFCYGAESRSRYGRVTYSTRSAAFWLVLRPLMLWIAAIYSNGPIVISIAALAILVMSLYIYGKHKSQLLIHTSNWVKDVNNLTLEGGLGFLMSVVSTAYVCANHIDNAYIAVISTICMLVLAVTLLCRLE